MTVPNFTDIEFLQLAIQSGALDGDLETIVRSVRMRQDLKGRLEAATMVEGDYIQVKDDVRPKYIAGAFMKITKFEGDRIHCRMLTRMSDPRRQGNWKMTMGSIKKVDTTSLPEYIQRAEGLI